ncbi:hypothetical protein MASR2M36_38500 [Providencia sp.]
MLYIFALLLMIKTSNSRDDPDKDQAVLDSDRVELFFATSPELKPYYTAEMDPKGRTFDAKANFYREVDPSWNWETLQTVGEITPNGYVLTGKIDLDEFSKLNLWQDKDKQISHVRYFTRGI